MNNQHSIFEEPIAVIEGSSTTTTSPTDTISHSHSQSPSTNDKVTERATKDGPTPTNQPSPKSKTENATSTQCHDQSQSTLLWSWIHSNCYQPFSQSFKGQFAAEALQVSVSVLPVMMYSLIRNPYIPCQDLPESALIELRKPKKERKKTWRQRVFSVESLCLLTS